MRPVSVSAVSLGTLTSTHSWEVDRSLFVSHWVSAAAFAAPSPKPEFWGIPEDGAKSSVFPFDKEAIGALSSVSPALAIVGSLWTGYSDVSTAGDAYVSSRTSSDPRIAGENAREAALTCASL